MNRTKFLAFIAFAAMLAACGSNDDDGGPPELANNNITISPFDTLVVKFNSNLVDADKLEVGQGKTLIKGNAVSSELRFIGTNFTDGHSPYFDGGQNSIKFKKLKNSDGYIKDSTVFYFYTIPILDKEPNASETYANDIDDYKDIIGDIRKSEVIFAGILDSIYGVSANGQELSDNRDYYAFKLKVGDTLFVTIENRMPLSLTINGPEGVAQEKSFQTVKGKPNEYSYIFGPECLIDKKCTDEPLSFYMNLARIAASPNPYTIRIKVVEYKPKQ